MAESISPLKYVVTNLRRHKARLAVAFFWSILFVIIPMQFPILTGALIDGIRGNTVRIYGVVELSSTPEETITLIVVGLGIIAALSGITAYFRTISVAKVSRRFVTELRMALVQKLEILSLDRHSRYGPGELLNRMILDTQQLRPFVDTIIVKNSTNIVRITYPLVVVFLLDPYLALLASSVLPVQWLVTRTLRSKLHKASRQARTSLANLTTVMKEHLDGIETIQTSNAGVHSVRKISGLAEKVEIDQVRTQKYSGMLSGFVWFITTSGLALIWWQGGLKVLAGTMSVGTLIAFSGLWLFVYEPLRDFYKSINEYQKGVVACERIQEIVNLPSTIQESPGATNLKLSSGRIEFREVYFSYPETDNQQETLANVNLRIEPKSLTGIVGRSGAGKSSILKLITRLYDPIKGRILIDDQDIKGVTLDSLRSHIAVVPQAPMIFSGTVAENFRLVNPDATNDEIEEACRGAEALDFILRLDDGFETRLGQGGANLSGGQIQRVAIARALIRRPRILLLDEPGSALDSEAEASIMATLNRLKRDMTILIVGHHLKAISGVDRIVVINKGEVVEDGSHEELISSRGLYSSLYHTFEFEVVDPSDQLGR
jgi:ABC-type multidrug transport system fused ATPase/permease subunit